MTVLCWSVIAASPCAVWLRWPSCVLHRRCGSGWGLWRLSACCYVCIADRPRSCVAVPCGCSRGSSPDSHSPASSTCCTTTHGWAPRSTSQATVPARTLRRCSSRCTCSKVHCRSTSSTSSGCSASFIALQGSTSRACCSGASWAQSWFASWSSRGRHASNVAAPGRVTCSVSSLVLRRGGVEAGR